MRKLFLLLLALLIGLGTLFLNIRRNVFQPYQGYEKNQVITIEPGMTAAKVAQLLFRQGVIRSSFYFKLCYRFGPRGRTLKSGEYLFERPLSLKQVLQKLQEGKVIQYKITIPEGLWMGEIADMLQQSGLIARNDFLQAARDPGLISDWDEGAQDLEGYLFPDTYLIPRGLTAREMVAIMVGRFRQNFTNTLRWRARDIRFSIRQTVILASLIEKETSQRSERFLISSVFHNRLKRQMLLDCDPTIVYLLKRENRYQGRLGWEDLKRKSPYNTRLSGGLPPGPICNPGLASLEAALYPENTNYLYFVARDSGSHQFSGNLNDHNRAVRKYILDHKTPGNKFP